MRKLVVSLLCLGLVAAIVGCAETQKQPTKPQEVVNPTPAPKPVSTAPVMKDTSRQEPMWIQQLGPWEEQWRRDKRKEGEAEDAKKWMFVVGTSKAVASIKDQRLAFNTASQDALGGLSKALGIDFTSDAKTATVWASTPTGEVVDGLFRKALEREMAKMKINLREYSRWGYSTQEGPHSTYTLMVLFRLNRERFRDQNVLQKAADQMKKELAERKDISKKVREEANDIAKKMVMDAESALKPQ